MALGGRVPRSYFLPFDRAWNIEGNGAPKDFDLDAGRKVMDMNDAGYRAIAALTACVARGVRIPRALQRYRNTTYFSSSLHLLALSAARANHPRCVDETPPGKVLVAEHFERGMARLRARR
jgi:endoglucanase